MAGRTFLLLMTGMGNQFKVTIFRSFDLEREGLTLNEADFKANDPKKATFDVKN